MIRQLIILLLMGFLSWLFGGCSESRPKTLMARQIKIEELKASLTDVQNGHTEYNFIGITSNGVDCIYFIYEKGKFNIEFEAMGEDQLPYIERLTNFASSNNFKCLSTTYNNEPNYPSNKPAPVLRIETNTTLDETTILGAKIQSEVFFNKAQTVYDIVP